MHVQGVVQSLFRGPVEERLGIGELGGVEVPTAPGVGGLEVGVGDEDVERHAGRAERGQDGVLVVARRPVDVLGVPHAVGPAGQQSRWAGQRGEVGQTLLVVVAEAEEVAVLVGPAVVGGTSGRLPGAGVVDRGRSVVEQVPAVAVQQAGCGPGGGVVVAVESVEAAPVAAQGEVRCGGRVLPGGQGEGVHVDVATGGVGAAQGDLVRAGLQADRDGRRRPGVPVVRRGQGQGAVGAAPGADPHAPRLVQAVAARAVGVAQVQQVGAVLGYARDPVGDAGSLAEFTGESEARVALVVGGDDRGARQERVLGLAARAEPAARDRAFGPGGIGGSGRQEGDAVDVDVPGVGGGAVQPDRVVTGAEGQRQPGHPPGVPVARLGEAERPVGAAVHAEAQGPGLVAAVTADGVGVAHGEVVRAGRLGPDVRGEGVVVGLEPGQEALAGEPAVVRGESGAVVHLVLRLAQDAGGTDRVLPGSRQHGLLSRLEPHAQVVRGEGAGADPVAQGHRAGGDGQDAVADRRGVAGWCEGAPADRVEGGPVLEAAVPGVLGTDQGR